MRDYSKFIVKRVQSKRIELISCAWRVERCQIANVLGMSYIQRMGSTAMECSSSRDCEQNSRIHTLLASNVQKDKLILTVDFDRRN